VLIWLVQTHTFSEWPDVTQTAPDLWSGEYGEANAPDFQVSDIPDRPTVVGVMDLDCLALSGFQEEDRLGLERIARLITHSCDW
jgi:hypothetical protein